MTKKKAKEGMELGYRAPESSRYRAASTETRMEQGDSSAGVLDGVGTKLLYPGTARTSVAGVENLRGRRQRTGCGFYSACSGSH